MQRRRSTWQGILPGMAALAMLAICGPGCRKNEAPKPVHAGAAPAEHDPAEAVLAQKGEAEHKLTGKWSGEYLYGEDPGNKKTTLDLKELKDGKFIGIWADGDSGGTEIKGTRTGNKIAFSYTYIHKEYGECKGDGTGELSKDGKTMDFYGVETGKYKSGKTWTSKWKAILTAEPLPGEIVVQAGKIRFVTRHFAFGKFEPGADAKSLVVSPGSRRFAYVAKRGNKFAVVQVGRDGKAVSEPFHAFVGQLVFSPDRKRLAYAAEWQGKAVVVVDGKPGSGFVSVDAPFFSPDSRRIAYQAKEGKKWLVVVDSSEGQRYDNVSQPVFSPDSKRLAHRTVRAGKEFVVVDGKEGKEFDQVGEPVFSPDSRRVAYVALGGGKWRLVADGVEGAAYDDAHAPTFSPDSHQVACIAIRGDKFFVVVDGKEQKEYDQLGLGSLRFSADGQRLGYAAVRAGKFLVVVDGKEGPMYDALTEFSSLFSPDGKRLAYAAARGGKWRVVTDGADGPEYDNIPLDGGKRSSIRFSPDSKRMAYVAKRGGNPFQQFVVVDGVAGKPYDGIVASGVTFSPDSKHVVYGTGRSGGPGFVVVDGVECGQYDGFLTGSSFVFDRPDAFHTLARKGNEVFRVDVEITEQR